MDTRWARLLRGFSAGAFATGVAALMHGAAGGSFASPLGLVLSLSLSGILGTLLAGRSLSLARLSIVVSASQGAFHAVFNSLGETAGANVHFIGGHHAGHLVVQLSGMTDHAAMPDHAAMSGEWMLVAHVFAAILTIAALRHGERAFWGFRDTAIMWLSAIFRGSDRPLPVTGETNAWEVTPQTMCPRIALVFLEAMSYRGPPLGIRPA